MSALSIRNMNFTLQAMQHIRDQKDAEIAATMPHVDWYDWIVERPSRSRRNKYVTVIILQRFTKAEFAHWRMKHRHPGWKARVIFNPQKLARQLRGGVLP